jgi:hypothetical protein
LGVELEHGTHDPDTNVTDDDAINRIYFSHPNLLFRDVAHRR